MKTYTTHLKAGRPPVLQPEGWSWGAFLFGPLWLLTQRAWIPALLEIAVIVGVFAAAPALGTPILLGVALLNLVLGRDFARWSLERRGYALAHVVLAPDGDAALLRLFTVRPDLVGRIS